MTCLSLRYILALSLLFLPSRLFPEINSNGDVQLWNQDSIFTAFNSEWACQGQTEMRWGCNGNTFYYQNVELTVFYKPLSWFWIGPTYRQEWNYLRNSKRPWSTIYSPYVNMSFAQTFSGWQLSSRNYFMYLITRGDRASEFRYRNRLQMILPKVNYFPIWLYISEELFIDQHGGFTQNRLAAGIQYTRKDRFRTALEYIYRSLKDPEWTYQNILNIRIRLEF